MEVSITSVYRAGISCLSYEFYYPKDQHWYETKGYPASPGAILVFRDITHRQHKEALQSIMERMIRTYGPVTGQQHKKPASNLPLSHLSTLVKINVSRGMVLFDEAARNPL